MLPRFLITLTVILVAFPTVTADYTDTGPLSLLITYQCEPAHRPAFRSYLETKGLAQFRKWKEEGVLKDCQLFFNWYVDEGTWDAMAMLRFHQYADVARWKEIEETMPGGLSQEALKLAKPVTTSSADIVWQKPGKPGDEVKEDRSESVFLLIPYKYLVLVSEYKKYVDAYVIPQLDGWLKEDVLKTYKVLLNRFPTGDRWGSMLVLEYKNLEAFGKRKQTKYKVREGLREIPEWKAYSDIKRTLRQEREPIIAELLNPNG
jgi:hypothetical protein